MKKLMAIALAVVLLLAMTVSAPVTANGEIHVYPGDSIQAAVNSANSGDTIIVHAGEYHQSVTIGTDNISLNGEKGAILDGTTPADNSTTLTGNGITLQAGVSGVTIEGLEIRNYPDEGISLFGASNNTVKKNKVCDNGWYGIWLSFSANDNEIIENKVIGSTSEGISVLLSTGNLIKKNKVADNGWGIVLGTARGIEIGNANDNEVIENEVVSSTYDGILVWLSTGNLIQKNKVADNGWGIALEYNANDNEVLKNEVTGSTYDGISVRWSSTGNLIKENEVSDSGWGIALREDANDNEVIANEVSGSTFSWGIYVRESTGNLIEKNEVSDSGCGIYLGYANDNQVIKNKVTGLTHSYGIYVSGSTGNLIQKNEVCDSGSGIFLGDANDNQVIKNKVTGSTGAGIAVFGSTGNLIEKNKVTDSGWLDLYDDSIPLPLDNTWEHNKYDTSNF